MMNLSSLENFLGAPTLYANPHPPPHSPKKENKTNKNKKTEQERKVEEKLNNDHDCWT